MLADFSFADDTIGYMIEGDMNHKTITELRNLVLEKLKTHDRINLYLEDRSITKFTFSAAAIGMLFPLEHARRFRKIALVTDRKWIHTLASIDNILIKADLLHFAKEDRIKAMSWIAQPIMNTSK